MIRDNEFIRTLLFEFEKHERPYMAFQQHSNLDEDEWKWLHHAQLLSDAGLLQEAVKSGGRQFRLTNAGHDFLETIRNDTAWNKVLEATRKAGSTTLKMLVDVALEYAKAELKEKTGLNV